MLAFWVCQFNADVCFLCSLLWKLGELWKKKQLSWIEDVACLSFKLLVKEVTLRRYLISTIVNGFTLRILFYALIFSPYPEHKWRYLHKNVCERVLCTCCMPVCHGNWNTLTYISRNIGRPSLYSTGTRVSLWASVLGLCLHLGHLICWPALQPFLPKGITGFPHLVWLDWKHFGLADGDILFMG